MRSLIFGATGFLGSHLVSACDERGFARHGTWNAFPHNEYSHVDLRDQASVQELISEYMPEVVFLASGLKCPDYAESFPEECREIMVRGAANVVEAVKKQGAVLAYFSSDEVFGDASRCSREEEVVSPKGELARAYADSESMIRESLPERHLIVRTSWLFGPEERPRNLGRRLFRRLMRGETLVVANDRHGQPTYAPDLARATLDLLQAGRRGTVHIVGPDRHTEFTFARLAAHIFGCDTDLVEGYATECLDEPGMRPKNLRLDRQKLRRLLGPGAIRSAADGLRDLRRELAIEAPLVRSA